MVTNKNPMVTIVLFGGSASQKIEMIEKITNLCPPIGEYDLILITNKKDNTLDEVTARSNFPIKFISMNKGANSVNLISSKVLKLCNTDYFIFQNVNEVLFNINKVIEKIKKNEAGSKGVVAFTTPVKSKDVYVIEDAPLLFTSKDISNIAFSRSLLQDSIGFSDRYEWKVNTLINSRYVSINPVKMEEVDKENISLYLQNFNSQLKKFSNLLSKTNINKYIKKSLVKNHYELIVSSQIGIMYKNIMKDKNSSKQVEFLKQFENMLKEIDLRILSQIPAIRYYFIRWSIDNYNLFSYRAKRQHIKIVKYIVNHIHFDSHQIYIEKHNKMYPAAIRAAKFNSIIPIYQYLIKRKIKKVQTNNRSTIKVEIIK